MRSTAFYERAISYNRCTNKKNDERRERENEKASERGSCCVCIRGSGEGWASALELRRFIRSF